MIVINATGNIGADAIIKTVNNRSYIAFAMCSTKRRKVDGVVCEESTWINVLTHENENLVKYLTKGQTVHVSGELRVGAYEGRDGRAHADLSVIANSLSLVGARPQAANDAQTNTAQGVGIAPAPTPAPVTATPANEAENDLPF